MNVQAGRRYAVIGTGALGGFYGSRLAKAGIEVHFLLHSDFEHVRRHGILVESVDGDFTLPAVNAYRAAADMPPCDVVLLCLKTTANHLLPELLPPAAGDDGVVVVMQNGLGTEDDAAAIVAPARVMGGLCFLCSNKPGPGHIRHLDYGWVTFGEYAADGSARGVTPRMRAVQADFERAGIQVYLAADLLLARWKKLVWNIPYNALSVLLDATTADIMADPAGRAMAADLMREVAGAAAACGKCIEDEFIRHMLDVTAEMAPYRPSMKIDYDAGRPMEVEAILGRPFRAAQAAGASCPRIELLYRQLRFLGTGRRGT